MHSLPFCICGSRARTCKNGLLCIWDTQKWTFVYSPTKSQPYLPSPKTLRIIVPRVNRPKIVNIVAHINLLSIFLAKKIGALAHNNEEQIMVRHKSHRAHRWTQLISHEPF